MKDPKRSLENFIQRLQKDAQGKEPGEKPVLDDLAEYLSGQEMGGGDSYTGQKAELAEGFDAAITEALGRSASRSESPTGADSTQGQHDKKKLYEPNEIHILEPEDGDSYSAGPDTPHDDVDDAHFARFVQKLEEDLTRRSVSDEDRKKLRSKLDEYKDEEYQ